MQIKLVFLFSIVFLAFISNNEARKHSKKCPRHMIYKKCTKTCPKTCDKNAYKGERCLLDCKHPGCECKRGYYLARKNKCVRKSKCHKYRITTMKPTTTPKCPPNTFYTDCLSTCISRCSDNEDDNVCTDDCGGAGCECPWPFVLNDKNECIPRNECPGYNTTTTTATTTRSITTTTTRMFETTTTVSSQQCLKNNTVFTLCLSACPLKCSDAGKIIPCTANCRGAGCECKQGYYLNRKNECVSITECINDPEEEVCPPNSEYTTCKSFCPKTCHNKLLKRRPCSLICAGAGCQCKSGYYLNKEGKCVTEEECDKFITTTTMMTTTTMTTTTMTTTTTPVCPANMVYTTCKSACQPKCSQKNKPHPFCIFLCAGKGCECRKPFALNDEGKCIPEEQCPSYEITTTMMTTTRRPTSTTPVCPPNMVFTFCKTACPSKCSERGITGCFLRCYGYGCECRKPFALNDNGDCIPQEECPNYDSTTTMMTTTRRPTTTPVCPPNMVYSLCKSACPPKCWEKVRNWCFFMCAGVGCECRKPFALNDKGECIPENQCPSYESTTTRRPTTTPVCPANMVYTKCKSSCPPKCTDKEGEPKICTFNCDGEGCECRAPFALDSEGNCIKKSECPISTTTAKPSKRRYLLYYSKKTFQSLLAYIYQK